MVEVIKLSPEVFKKFVEKINQDAERLGRDLRKTGSGTKEQ